MNNVRCVPLTSEDVQPYISHAVARLYLQHLYVGILSHGKLPSPRIENGSLIFRLNPIIRYRALSMKDVGDPGVSLLGQNDTPIVGSRDENFQKFSSPDPQKQVRDQQESDTLSIQLQNGAVVVFSRRERDIVDVMKLLNLEAQRAG